MMGRTFRSAVVLVLTIANVRSHLAWNNPDLHPVQGLYVKPSSDGTTGDLYVAATEDNGVHSQWLTDQPINFLSAQTKTSGLPLYASALASNALPHDESVIANQKRAVLAETAGKYSYGMPTGIPNYMPYAYAGIQSAKTETTNAKVGTANEAAPTQAVVPQYSPYYMYPHMLHAAYASAMKVMKDAGTGSEDASNSNSIASYPTAMWPASYYPMQYVMMDPTAWARSQAAVLASATTTTTSAPPPETSDEE